MKETTQENRCEECHCFFMHDKHCSKWGDYVSPTRGDKFCTCNQVFNSLKRTWSHHSSCASVQVPTPPERFGEHVQSAAEGLARQQLVDSLTQQVDREMSMNSEEYAAYKQEQAVRGAALVGKWLREDAAMIHPLGGGPTRATIIPTDSAERKQYPIATGVLDYFPDAIAAIAHLSWKGNDQHNPGQPVHWNRNKSQDEPDTLMRHFVQRGTIDTDGIRHSTKVAWRALANLQKELEEAQAEEDAA